MHEGGALDVDAQQARVARVLADAHPSKRARRVLARVGRGAERREIVGALRERGLGGGAGEDLGSAQALEPPGPRFEERIARHVAEQEVAVVLVLAVEARRVARGDPGGAAHGDLFREVPRRRQHPAAHGHHHRGIEGHALPVRVHARVGAARPAELANRGIEGLESAESSPAMVRCPGCTTNPAKGLPS